MNESKRWIKRIRETAVFMAVFVVTSVLLSWGWGLSPDSAFVGGFCSAGMWFVWKRTLETEQRLRDELQEMSLCLNHPKELEIRREKARMASCIRKGITRGHIKRGMSLQEVAAHLQAEGIETGRRFPSFEREKGSQHEVVFPEYFSRIPTPVIRLKFADGKLVDWKMWSGQDDMARKLGFDVPRAKAKSGVARKVLIVDDEKDLCLSVKKNLEQRGDYHVLIANNGEEGIRSARRYRPDVILLDIHMPGMSGMEVLKKLKSEEKTVPIPVLMLTAVRDSETRREAATLYDEDYIEKPVEIETLRSRIDVALSKSGWRGARTT